MKYGCLRFPDGEVSCSRLPDSSGETTLPPYHIGNDFPGRATHKGPLDELRVCIEADSDDEAITIAHALFATWDARLKDWHAWMTLTSSGSPFLCVFEATSEREGLRGKPGSIVVQAHCHADAREIAFRLLAHIVAKQPPYVPIQATLFTI